MYQNDKECVIPDNKSKVVKSEAYQTCNFNLDRLSIKDNILDL